MFRMLLGAALGAAAVAWVKGKQLEDLEKEVEKLAKIVTDRAKAAFADQPKPSTTEEKPN